MTDAARLTVGGTYNFRRIGGDLWPRAGLYRADALHRLTAAGRRDLRDLGITTVIDLRSRWDRRVSGRDRLRGTGAHVVSIPISGGSPGADLSAISLTGIYRAVLTDESAQVRAALTTIAASTAGVVVHCTAGKDRTGVISALLLRAVGVDDDTVVADYARTEGNLAGAWSSRMLRKARWARVPLTPALVEVITASPERAMRDTLAWLDETHGGTQAYLHAIGMTDADIAALRRRVTLSA